jgi:hypothetical protein
MSEATQGDDSGPVSVCMTCYGYGKIFTFALIDGRTRTVWQTCPRGCSGEVRPVPGP